MEYQLHDAAQLKHSANPYADEYTGFIWNGHHSSDFNCFIENTGHLTFEPAPEFSNSTVSPAFYDGSLYTGTQTQNKKIQLNLVFYHITLADFNKALKWLDYKKVSSLLFDYSDNWRYQCKLNSLGVTEKYIDGYCINQTHDSYNKQDLYICRMQVSFETIDIHNAVSAYTTVISESDENDYYTLTNLHSLPTYFRVHVFNITVPQVIIYSVYVDENNQEIKTPICSLDLNLDVGGEVSLHYNSKSGSVIMGNRLINNLTNGNGDLVAKYCNSTSELAIPPYDKIQLKFSELKGTSIMIDYDLQESVL